MTLISTGFAPDAAADALSVSSSAGVARLDAPMSRATLAEVFRDTARRHSQLAAIDAPDARLTYAELSERADRLAAELHARGIGRGDRVVVRVASGTAELYTAILGVLLAGAAYVPIDADDPPARVAQIRDGSRACAQIGDGLVIEPLTAGDAPGNRAGVPAPEDDAWIIFTSGSTGAPKGVAVTHASAAAFIAAEARLFDVGTGDRVLAGLSVGFDASCEEIWLAWAHAATLVPAPRDLVRAGVELGVWLLDRAITVVSTVPTLAALWDESCLHQVRLLILGGEACPEPLGWKLSAGREVWNTYGPTEATVVSTAAPIVPGGPITIGRALDGWQVAVIDEDGAVVAPGEAGELVIAGVGLGRYLDPQLDSERFAPLPELGWPRAYRTGDVVRESAAGLRFVGRRDDQVKLGGRRIELGEIEAVLARAPGVVAAAAAVRDSAAGNRLLVGYVVGSVDPAEVRAFVGRTLPAGIVPLVAVVDDLPRSSSGKVDRKALPWPVGGDTDALAAGIGADGETLTDAESWLAELWIDQLGPVAITAHSDFFALGGTSLAAAKLISVLRERYPTVAIADLYHEPTLRQLAQRLDALAGSQRAVSDTLPGADARGWAARRLGALQLAGVGAIFALRAVPWALGTLAYGNLVALGTPHVSWAWLVLAWVLFASPPARVLLQVGVTRLLLGGVVPGRHPRYGTVAFRLWFVDRLADVTKYDRLGGTPWAARYARLAGADVGTGARLASMPPAGALVRIGARATVEAGVDMHGWWIDGDAIVVGRIDVGADARIGTRTMLEPGARVGDGAEVEPGSSVAGDVPAGERWGGVPAERLGDAGEGWPAQAPERDGFGSAAHQALFAMSFALEALIAAIAVAPALALIDFGARLLPQGSSSIGDLLLAAGLFTVVTIPIEAVVVALALRLVWKLVRPGWHSEYTLVGWALWFAEQIRENSMTQLFPLYASLYTRPWMRLMGITIGRRTEVSVTTGLNPLVSFGELGQCTDDIGFCGVSARGGWIHVEPISVGDRTFLGPGAILRGGTTIGDDSLIGVMTAAPLQPAHGTSWLGVPAIELPRVPDGGDAARTTAPPARLLAARAGMDLVRLLVPNTLVLAIELLVLAAFASLAVHAGIVVALIVLPAVMLGGGVAGTALTVAFKWTLIGRYRRSRHPLWSWFVWRDELINSAQEQLAGGPLIETALGTPLMSMYLRALGARVGAGVWCETLAVTEYDMIDLGDGAAVNRGACLMTHLFHDRMLRIGPTRVAAGAALAPVAAVLPDTVVGAGTTVGPHSVVLRGEELPAGTRWQGTPVAAA